MEGSYLQELIRDSIRNTKRSHKSSRMIYLRRMKVKFEAYQGNLNEVLTEIELKEAKRYGKLPRRFNVHHIIPLCCKNSSFELDNLVITDVSFHDWLHTYIYNPVIGKMNENDVVHIVLPKWKSVMTIQDLDPVIKEFYEKKAKNQISLKCFNILHHQNQR